MKVVSHRANNLAKWKAGFKQLIIHYLQCGKFIDITESLGFNCYTVRRTKFLLNFNLHCFRSRKHTQLQLKCFQRLTLHGQTPGSPTSSSLSWPTWIAHDKVFSSHFCKVKTPWKFYHDCGTFSTFLEGLS